MIHGGEIYDKQIEYDFSVNLNPMPCPETVTKALKDAIYHVDKYPDIDQREFRSAVADSFNRREMRDDRSFAPEMVIGGNGASELLAAAIRMIAPKRVLLPVPSFYGYVHALKMLDECEIVSYELRTGNEFELGTEFADRITDDIDAVILANPNNPTGKCIKRNVLERIIAKCKDTDTALIVDECFYSLSDSVESVSARDYICDYSRLYVADAYTKLFSIPGVRAGYLLSQSQNITELRRFLPEWNMSAFALAAGVACADECTDEFIDASREVIRKERGYLSEELAKLGIKVFSSDSNYLLIYSKYDLYELLLQKGILIRDCSNYEGLEKGFYRVAIKSHGENESLIKALRTIFME